MKALVLLLLLALAPVAINSHLRNVYRQTLAHWLAKVVPPPTVFIGDSIMTGGMWFDDVRNINLAANSLRTDQVVKLLERARSYHPKRIVIMAGMNDAIYGFDPAKIRGYWEAVCKEPNVVITLVSPSKHDELNREIDQINRIIRDACPGKLIVTLDVADQHGRLKPEFAADSVHLNAKGYEQWISQLKRPTLERRMSRQTRLCGE